MHEQPDADPPAPDAQDAARTRAAQDLKDAFDALGDPRVPDAARPDLHRRLIAITNGAKHDLAIAERRMQAWWAAWREAVGEG